MVEKRTDWFLDSLLDAASDGADSIRVLLYLPGMIVSGTLTGQPAFIESLTDYDVSSHDWRPLAADLAEREREVTAETEALFAKAQGEDRKLTVEEHAIVDRLSRRFVHMKDVTIIGPGIQRFKMPLWRGQLLDVIGWNFGFIPDDF